MSRPQPDLLEYGIALFQRRLSLAARDVLTQCVQGMRQRNSTAKLLEAYLLSGSNWLQMKRYDMALQNFEAAEALLRPQGDRHPAWPIVQFDLALTHSLLGNVQSAVECAAEAWRIVAPAADAEGKGGIAPDVALLLGRLYIAQECWDDALQYSYKALESFERAGDRPGMAKALNNIGLVYIETGAYDEARRYLERSLDVKRELNDAGSSVYTLTELGRMAFKQGDLGMAVRHGRTALQILWQNVGLMDKAEVARLCRLFGSVAASTGDRQSASSYLQRASTYYAQLGLWREWSAVNAELQDLVRRGRTHQPARAAIEWEDKVILRYFTTLLGLMDTMESLYPELRGKSELVTAYALLLGEACRLDKEELQHLSHAARLADIGLTSNDADGDGAAGVGRRSAEHPLLGEKILEVFSVSEETRIAVRHHHEHYDGSGSPDGLKGERIPLASRILAVVEAYVTRAAVDVEDGGVGHAVSMQHLWNEAGKRFDPNLVELFSAMHEYV